ncbi:MAG: DUF1853 family protein [Verrucomicrobiae bacterium]|nr:DUF1853 family protein [Verrucomicrobiae bacterium]NNJ86956.1 DUF1853 family protein [Akkermansiaceae bacterium]
MMGFSSNKFCQALFQSSVVAPLLVDELPQASAFPCHTLVAPKEPTPLNFQQKLGHLYEDVLAVMLKSTPRYESLARGMQICQNAGRTLGELDFLVRDLIADQLIHLELAVKFYLVVETPDGVLLPGPDARDNYFRKLEKMQSHQLLLVEKYQHLMPEEFRHHPIITQHAVHGCIFEHVHAKQQVQARCLNRVGRRGKWLHAKDCKDYFGEKAQLEIIPKPLWPVPLNILQGISLEKWEPDQKINRCVMVRDEAVDKPYFIAPDGYPANQHNSSHSA